MGAQFTRACVSLTLDNRRAACLPALPPPTQRFWDYVSGHCYQQVEPVLQPGSLESEAGVYACSYDVTGTRLITCNADKTIGCYKPAEDATPANAPGLPFQPPSSIRRF